MRDTISSNPYKFNISDKGEEEGGEKVNCIENEVKFSLRKMVEDNKIKLNLVTYFFPLFLRTASASFVSFLRTISVYTILLTRGSLNR